MKKALIFRGGWDGHEPALVSQRFGKALEKLGISEGDPVQMYEVEFDYIK